MLAHGLIQSCNYFVRLAWNAGPQPNKLCLACSSMVCLVEKYPDHDVSTASWSNDKETLVGARSPCLCSLLLSRVFLRVQRLQIHALFVSVVMNKIVWGGGWYYVWLLQTGVFRRDCVRRGEANLSFTGNSTLPLSAMYISVLTALSVLNVPVCTCLCWHFCSFMYWQHCSHFICLLWHQCALYLSVSTSQSALYLSVLTSAYWQQYQRQHISHQTIHPDILRHNLTRIQLHLKSQKL